MAKRKVRKKKLRAVNAGKGAKETVKEPANPHAIIGFTIRDLFGYLNYDLVVDAPHRQDLGRLAILYGVNGTGKTTILKLAYHMLSSVGGKGHKSYVATIPFKTFGVTLLDGTTVFAERSEATKGSYSLSVARPHHGAVSHMFVAVDEPPRIPVDRAEDPSYDLVINALGEVASTFFYLADDRSLNIEYHERPGARVSFDVGYFESYLRRAHQLRVIGEEEEESITVVVALEAAIRSLNRWFSLNINYASSQGFASTHSVYADVMRQIVSPVSQRREVLKATLEEKIEKLKKLALESKVFQQYALSSELDVGPLIRTVSRAATSYKRRTLSNVFTAYLKGLENWFIGLRSIYNTIDAFIKCLNGFLNPKIARFRVDEGLTLLAPNGEVLSPDMLSSGERHLLLILCCTVILSDQRAIFIVDEPEISLNIVWQRKLLRALLAMSENSNMQFLMASHSIQVTTPYSNHVMQLSLKKR